MTTKSKLKLPKTLKLGPYTFTTRLFKQTEDPEKRGWISFLDQEICLVKDRHTDSSKQTLLHELLHAAFYTGQLEAKEEEKIVEVLSMQLATFFAQNPKLKDVFFGEQV